MTTIPENDLLMMDLGSRSSLPDDLLKAAFPAKGMKPNDHLDAKSEFSHPAYKERIALYKLLYGGHVGLGQG